MKVAVFHGTLQSEPLGPHKLENRAVILQQEHCIIMYKDCRPEPNMDNLFYFQKYEKQGRFSVKIQHILHIH